MTKFTIKQWTMEFDSEYTIEANTPEEAIELAQNKIADEGMDPDCFYFEAQAGRKADDQYSQE